MEFTGLKDIDREILSKLDSDTDLFNACSVNKYFWKLGDDHFFRNRLISKYPNVVKYNENGKWKQYYLNVMYYISKTREVHNFLYQTGNPKIYYDILFKTPYPHVQIEKSAENNYLDLVNFLLNDKPSLRHIFLRNVFQSAALRNHLCLIQHFLKEANSSALNKGLRGAIQGQHLDLVIFFLDNGATEYGNAMKWAVAMKNSKLLDYLKNF